jgi:hypothetical protein
MGSDAFNAVVLLVPIILVLLGLLAVASAELWAVLTNRNPYTIYGRVLAARYPVIAIGITIVVAGFIGWLTGHLFAGCF